MSTGIELNWQGGCVHKYKLAVIDFAEPTSDPEVIGIHVRRRYSTNAINFNLSPQPSCLMMSWGWIGIDEDGRAKDSLCI